MRGVRIAFLLAMVLGSSVAWAAPVPEVPVKGMVTMVDLGAKSCVPCKMMMPVMEAVEKAYQGKAAVLFIDVWENHDQAAKFGLKLIPTQIFYDKAGKEVYRHEGFLDQEAISAKLDALLSQ